VIPSETLAVILLIIYAMVSAVLILLVRNLWYRHPLVYLWPFIMVAFTGGLIVFLKHGLGDGESVSSPGAVDNLFADALINSFLVMWSAILGATIMFRGERGAPSGVEEEEGRCSLARLTWLYHDLRGVSQSLSSDEPRMPSLCAKIGEWGRWLVKPCRILRALVVPATVFVLAVVLAKMFDVDWPWGWLMLIMGVLVSAGGYLLALYQPEYRLLSRLVMRPTATGADRPMPDGTAVDQEGLTAFQTLPVETRRSHAIGLSRYLEGISLLTQLLRAAVLVAPPLAAWLAMSVPESRSQLFGWALLLAVLLYLILLEWMCRARTTLMRLQRLQFCLEWSLREETALPRSRAGAVESPPAS